MLNFMKIRLAVLDLFNASGQMDERAEQMQQAIPRAATVPKITDKPNADDSGVQHTQILKFCGTACP
jgi:hypothetical protein